MKKLEEILLQEPVFLNNWSSREDVVSDYSEYSWSSEEEKRIEINGNILFASYGSANYSGDAFVLYERDGELFEVGGSHCSCYGLEGQWSPDGVTIEELEHRLVKGQLGEDDYSGNTFKKELCEFLGVEFIDNKKKWY